MAVATRTVPATARRLIDNRVRDYDGNSVGEVEDFVIDPARGCIDYAVISFGGFMGLGKEYHVIPYQVLSIHPDGGGFATNIRREQLERAPGFDRGNVPDMGEDYLGSVYSYWGVQRGGDQGQPMTGTQTSTYGEQQMRPGAVQSGTAQERQEGQQPRGYHEQPRDSYEERQQAGSSGEGSSRENEGDRSPWQERYRGIFWGGRDEDRNR